eukprot:gene15826-17422_t
MSSNGDSFVSFGLDDRILKAISKLGWPSPTPVQNKVIPLAIEGKDIVARAKTGSGKTAAYILPVIQKIIDNKLRNVSGITAVIIVPSKELCKQAHAQLTMLTAYCSKDVRGIDIGNKNVESSKPLLAKEPDMVFTTPSKLLVHLKHKVINLEKVETIILDEADVMFSYGYEKDLNELFGHLPRVYQALMLSATMSSDVRALKKKFLNDPVILKVDESDLPEESKLAQYLIKCEAGDKFLLLLSLLKLNLVRGKTLVFVNDITRCYKLKLFLEQFSLSSCVINSELPQNSRLHIVEQFNKGIYDIVIATDEAINVKTSTGEQGSGSKGSKVKQSKDYSVSRGIDFQDVENIVNFDFPINADSYVHRVGRTARGNSSGTALSLVSTTDEEQLKEVNLRLSASPVATESILKPYLFKMEEIEGFRYRVNDALRAVTKVSIREARLKEIKSEILTSNKLKTFFEDNPKDLKVLRHDKTLQPKRIQPHMKNIPEYLVPQTLKSTVSRSKRKRPRFDGYDKGKSGKKTHGKKGKHDDPLKTFKFKGSKSKKRR